MERYMSQNILMDNTHIALLPSSINRSWRNKTKNSKGHFDIALLSIFGLYSPHKVQRIYASMLLKCIYHSHMHITGAVHSHMHIDPSHSLK